jgi:hypothetical protein
VVIEVCNIVAIITAPMLGKCHLHKALASEFV